MTLNELKQKFVEQCNRLKEFTSEDFTNLTTDRIRIGRLIYFYRCKGLIRAIDRARYQVVSKNVKNQRKSLITSIPETKYKILYGLELELEYNKIKLGKIMKNSYHSVDAKKFNKYFIAESDGSLRSETFPYGEGDTVELISIPMTSENVMKSLQNFKEDIIQRYKEQTGNETCELKDVISFNTSTGAHVHMSLLVKNSHDEVISLRNNKKIKFHGQSKNIMSFSNIEFMKKIARKIKTRIKNELPEFYESFVKNYYRRYARRMTTRTSSSQRYTEFNTTNNKTIEYRSLHLRGIETWTQLFKFYEIVTSVTDTEFNTQFNSEKPFCNETISNIEIESEFEEIEVDEVIENNENDETIIQEVEE